jgi:hypothetical protein
MKAWTKGARVMQPAHGSGTLVEVNEHHTGIACEHGRRRPSKQHEDRHQHGRSCRALTQETTRSEAIRFWRTTPSYNRAVAVFDAGNRSAILSRDTSADVERLQIETWRRMSPLEKVGIMSQATSDALTLALSGIRQRHPGASARECFVRLAALRLGPTLVCQVYPDASQILGPHV